jgi:hypothetical protein
VWQGDKHRFVPVPGWSRVFYCLCLRLIIPFIPKRKLVQLGEISFLV